MRPFVGRKRGRGRRDIAGVIDQLGSDAQVPGMPMVDSPEKARRRVRYEELKFKKENDPLNWTEELWEEFRPLVDEFF